MLLQNLVSHQPFHFPDMICFCAFSLHINIHPIFIWTFCRALSHLWLCLLTPSIPLCFYPHVTFSVNLAISLPKVCCLGHIIKTPNSFMTLFLTGLLFQASTAFFHSRAPYSIIVQSSSHQFSLMKRPCLFACNPFNYY